MHNVKSVKILGALQSPDGRYRVEVVQHRADLHYRLLRDGEVWQPLAALGAVEVLLSREGVDLGDFVEAPAASVQDASGT